jgi:UDP-N-acetylmuramoyl-tripeptide--D-alanyl-D-alanine ligase
MKAFFKKILVFILIAEAKAVIRRYKPRIVAVTGSVGKTSTKDAIYEVLAQSMRSKVRKSQKSFNSEVGLPLTILGRPNAWNNPLGWLQNIIDGLFLIIFHAPYPEWLVLEVGADRPGDIQSVAKWLPVEIAVITRLPEVPVHVEFFSSPQQVVDEKAALIDALQPEGTLVIYGDDERAEELRPRASGKHIITFGMSEKADVRAEGFSVLYEEGVMRQPVGITAQVGTGGKSMPLSVIGTVGAHMLLPALAAVAVGRALGKDLVECVQALQQYAPPPGRMHLLRGLKGSVLIDDTYNSSPAAVAAALDTLLLVIPKGSKQGRRIAVLGDMLELGRHSVEEHRQLGAYTAVCADILVTVGFRARDIVEGALDAGMKDEAILQYEDATKAGEELAGMIKEGDCILVKGSQSMRMEKAVKQLMEEPERAEELLVRQDIEWTKK